MTFAQWEQESAERAFDFLDHLQEYPPDYVILAAVHLKPKTAKPRILTEAEMAEQSRHLRSMMPTAPIPAHLRELVEWSKAQDRAS